MPDKSISTEKTRTSAGSTNANHRHFFFIYIKRIFFFNGLSVSSERPPTSICPVRTAKDVPKTVVRKAYHDSPYFLPFNNWST